MEEYKKKLEEQRQRKAEEARLFNIEEVLADSSKIREVYVEEIEAKVRYGPLTIGDLSDVLKGETDQERAILMLWKMLSKADEKITLEKVKALPIDVATAILTKITAGPLQPTLKKLQSGLKATPTRSYSA